ncbi:hypothetical protein ACH42_16490 [Endozoicomonas sp. (ex Bugula neritina AB1)]|nr:hypothetical protein ACH42_16490 [Endozoicomonas sp. (ex Bugula neritina AB1)]
MTRSLTLTLASTLIFLLLIWCVPLITKEWFQWLTSFWQWCLTITTLALLVGALSWKRIQSSIKRLNPDQASSNDDYRQSKQALDNDWRLLWKTLSKRHEDSPYALPWLMMVGTYGSGKTGWLIDTGFEKISTSDNSQESGIVFWLGEHAVIVELAGHYYARDKELLDEHLWQHIITLLKKKRPRRPLTGIIAALSTDQLVMRQPSGLMELARQLRWRFLELSRQFDMRVPSWILLTQADRLSGFTELFRRRSSRRQVQPWGFHIQEGYHRDSFQKQFNLCQQELAESLLDCLHHEKEGNIRQAQVRYVLQFTLLGERLRFFCEEIFQSRHGIPSPILKGIWFSSCRQYGNSVNLLASELARQHGFRVLLEQPQIPDNQSYFNQQFFNRILFNDLGTSGENPSARKRWLLKNTLITSILLFTLFTGLNVLWSQIRYNNVLLDQQKHITNDYRLSMNALGNNPLLLSVIQPLSQLQSLNRLYQRSSDWFYHGAILDWNMARSVNIAYRKQLDQKLIKPLARLLHSRLQYSETQHSQSLFDDLQYYLMLFKPKLRDTRLLNNHIQHHLVQHGNLNQSNQSSLNSLLTDVWALDSLSIKPDKELILRASQILINQPDERIIYDHIRALPEYLDTITTQDLFGNEFASQFILNSKKEQAGLPRLYTHAVYKSLDLSATSPLLRQELTNLKKIEVNSTEVSSAEMIQMSRQVRELYFQDYIRVWHDYINRIELRPVNSLPQLSQQIIQLNDGSNALLTNINNTIISETSLAEPETSTAPLTLAKKAGKAVPSEKIQKAEKLAQFNQNLLTDKSITPDNPAIVNMAFADYVRDNTSLQARLTPILNTVLKELQTVTEHYNQQHALYNIAISVAKNEKNALYDLWQLASTDNTQNKQWLNLLAHQIWKQAIKGAAHYCQNQWQQTIYTFWRQYISNHFPFLPQSKSDTVLSDMESLFKPKGLLDSYVKNTLEPFLQETPSGWHVKSIKGQTLPVSLTLLQQLTNAKNLQQQLFNDDGNLQVNYRMRCNELTAEATELSLRDNNGRFVYRHGPQLWQNRKWPDQGAEQLSVSMSNNSTRLFQQDYDGAWAWLRFIFDSHQWQNGNTLDLKYNNKGYSTQLELALDKRGNPFSPELFKKIKLPENILQ